MGKNAEPSSVEFEKLVKKIGEDVFWRAGGFEENGRYGNPVPDMGNGARKPCRANVSAVQRTLKLMGYDDQMIENMGKLYPMQEESRKPQNKERSR